MQQHALKTETTPSSSQSDSLLLRQHGISLSSDSLQLALTGSLGLGTLGVHLVLDGLLTGLLSLGAVNLHWMLDMNGLV